MGKMSHRVKEKENVGSPIGLEGSCNSILEDPVLFLRRMNCASGTLQKKRLLFGQVLTYPVQKCPHGWVVTVEQRLQTVVPALYRIRCPSHSCDASVVLIPLLQSEQSQTECFNSTPRRRPRTYVCLKKLK